MGSPGGSYEDALAESVIALFKTEVIRQRGPWRGLERARADAHQQARVPHYLTIGS